MTTPNQNAADGTALPDRLVSREVAAEFLGLSPSTLACWASAGCGPALVKMSGGRSGAVRYRWSELEKFATDPQAYRPRLVTKFNKVQLKRTAGNPAIHVGKARARRGKGARGV